MKNISIIELSNKIGELAKANFEASWQGLYKEANKAFAKTVPLKKYIVDNMNIADELTKKMIDNDNIHMRHQGMVIALSLGVNIQKAKKELSNELVLENSIDPMLRKIAFEAKMIKKNIDDYGHILMYNGQLIYAYYDKDWQLINKNQNKL